MNLQKQPSWAKELELLALVIVIVAANTFLSVTKIIDPQVATGIATTLTGAVLLAAGHKLGLQSVPIATLENIVNQVASITAPQAVTLTSTTPLPLLTAPAADAAPATQPAPVPASQGNAG